MNADKVNDIVQKSHITFPCENYSIRVVGFQVDNFQGQVLDVLQKYDNKIDESKITLQASSKGKYVALRLLITAQSEQQLKDLNADLRQLDFIQTVL
jgi:putative lipoic acid-binding regulatory protein